MSKTAHREFYAELREAFLAAGPPTYSRLVVIMRRLQEHDPHRITLGSSALQTMMSHGGKILPRWAILSAVIDALRMAARETGLDPNAVGTVEQWHQRLLKAAKEATEETARETAKDVAGEHGETVRDMAAERGGEG